MITSDERIYSLIQDAHSHATTEINPKGALLESTGGELFYSFDNVPDATTVRSIALIEHAEIQVLRKAGQCSRGATLYITRPPCLHCCHAILKAGIACVMHPDHCGDDIDYASCEQGNLLLGLNGVEVELWTPEKGLMN